VITLFTSSKECSVQNTKHISPVRIAKKCSACNDRYTFLACFAGDTVESFRATSTVYSYHPLREAAVEVQKVVLRCIFDNAQDGALFCAIPFLSLVDSSRGTLFIFVNTDVKKSLFFILIGWFFKLW
jgi:hypothetical protein